VSSVKKNFGYNLLLTFCKYLFPLITYPYVSRVLGVDSIGVCNFVDGIIDFFVLLSALGVGSYGVREIAKCKNDESQKNKVFSNLVFFNFVGTSFSIVLLIVGTFCVPAMYPYKDYLWIGVVKLFFNMFLIEWFFQGLQKFRYITIRSILVRLFYVVCVFVFVHDKSDAIVYYALTAVTIVLNAVCNWMYARQFGSFSWKMINLKLYIIPVLTFGYYRILTYMYTSFNTVFLGFCSGDREVGYFSTATKLYGIIMGVFSAFTTVMIPRVSELIGAREMTKVQSIADKTFSALSKVAFPIIIVSVAYAKDIIRLIAGAGYEGAETPFRIVIFLMIIVGMEQIVISQFLMASSSNKSIFLISSVGASVGLFSNILLTPKFGAIGTSVAWGISEFSVLCVGVVALEKNMHIFVRWKELLLNLIWSLAYIPLPLALFVLYPSLGYMSKGLVLLAEFGIFVLINFVFYKNELLLSYIRKMKKR